MSGVYYKEKFNRPRPSSLSPGLFPPVNPPRHASYPSGHATQAMLISLFLEQIIPGLTPITSTIRNGTLPATTQTTTDGLLRSMASRIARNREVLGLHFPSDSLAGEQLAQLAFLLMLQAPAVIGKFGITPGNNYPAPRPAIGAPSADWHPQTYPSAFTTGNQYFVPSTDGLLAQAYSEWNTSPT